MDILPIDDQTGGTTSPSWATVHYALVGHPNVVAAIDATSYFHAGKCRDSDLIPVPGAHGSDGSVGLEGQLAPAYGAGVLSLPVPETLAATDQIVEYRLNFAAGQGNGPQAGEWLDLAQLQFLSLHSDKGAAPSAVYRVRRQYFASGGQLQVIEVRAPEPPSKPDVTEQVIAAVPLPAGVDTPVALRWRQWVGTDPCAPTSEHQCQGSTIVPSPVVMKASSENTAISEPALEYGLIEYPLPPEGELPPVPLISSETTLEVLGPGDQVLYTAELSDQWAELLLMGLLDFRVAGPVQIAETIGAMSLEARTFPISIETQH